MTTKHYEKLFKYDRTDYISWAYGLKECGYATDPKYAEKLIEKINKYYLSTYDSYESPYRTILKY
jgi:flagellum-specific peptidoglycan hydrolase FlgJ